MLNLIEKLLGYFQDNPAAAGVITAVIGFFTAVIGFVTALIGRIKVNNERVEIKSTPLPPTPNSAAVRDNQLEMLSESKRALRHTMICMVAAVFSCAAVWFFATEMASYIRVHGPVEFDTKWGKGHVILGLLVLSYVGLATWLLFAIVQFFKGVQLYRGSR